MKIDSITFITGNEKKVEQFKRYCDIPVTHKKLNLDEIQSLDPDEIIGHKVREAYKIIGSPVLVEDVSLRFNALGKLPGPLIRWFLEELGNEGLCELANKFPDNSAVAEVHYALFDGDNLQTFVGRLSGHIPAKPRGNDSFGWNPIFVPDGSDKTLAEMDLEEHSNFSIRKIALEKLAEYLNS